MDKIEVKIAGFGGQGILLIGQVLAYTAKLEGRNVSWLPSYGPQMRGGTANCNVVISTKEILSPLVLKPDFLIAMNKPSLLKFEKDLNSDGIIFLNEDMVDSWDNKDKAKNVRIPADSTATQLGDTKISNMVMLGSFIKVTNLFPLDAVFDALNDAIPKHRQNLISLNIKALEKGYELGKLQ